MNKIINIDGVYKLPDEVLEDSTEARFDYIFNTGVWAGGAGGESASGSGSTIQNTEVYRHQLLEFLKVQKNNPITFFDAPCGDLNWIRPFLTHVQYIGGDISGDLIDGLKIKYPDIELTKFDVTKDAFPAAHLWHCRHCLFHLSLSDVARAFENFEKSSIPTCLITNHFLPDSITFDIPTGSFRPLDLTNFPFFLPKPKLWLLDWHPLSGKLATASGLWSRSDIGVAVSNYRKFIETELGEN